MFEFHEKFFVPEKFGAGKGRRDANYNYLYEKNKHWLKDEVYFLIHNEK